MITRKSVSDISKEILAQYHEEFDDDDGILHDVYFALAKAEWMCCEQSVIILRRVKEIIESDANLEFGLGQTARVERTSLLLHIKKYISIVRSEESQSDGSGYRTHRVLYWNTVFRKIQSSESWNGQCPCEREKSDFRCGWNGIW